MTVCAVWKIFMFLVEYLRLWNSSIIFFFLHVETLTGKFSKTEKFSKKNDPEAFNSFETNISSYRNQLIYLHCESSDWFLYYTNVGY